MATRKHNWPALKEDFMLSQFLEVSEWYRLKYDTGKAPMSGTFKRMTLGWTNEKIERNKNQRAITVERLLAEEAESNAKALIQVYRGVKQKIRNAEALEKLPMGDVEKAWRMLSAVNAQPTTYTKTENTNTEKVDDDITMKLLAKVKELKHAKHKKKKI